MPQQWISVDPIVGLRALELLRENPEFAKMRALCEANPQPADAPGRIAVAFWEVLPGEGDPEILDLWKRDFGRWGWEFVSARS